MCATNSCARAQAPGSDPECDSGFAYLPQPFASEQWAHHCVPAEHAPPEGALADLDDGLSCNSTDATTDPEKATETGTSTSEASTSLQTETESSPSTGSEQTSGADSSTGSNSATTTNEESSSSG